jgi:hypothetical protein
MCHCCIHTSASGTPCLQVKRTGRVLLLEHCRSDNALLGWYQGVTSEAVAAAGKGCVWDQVGIGAGRGYGDTATAAVHALQET